MDPKTLQLIIFAEQMVGLAAKTIADLRGVIGGSSAKDTDAILADADATYRQIIANAQAPTVTADPPTSGPVTPQS